MNRRPILALLALLAVVLVSAGQGLAHGSSTGCVVPRLSGLSLPAAGVKLEQAGCGSNAAIAQSTRFDLTMRHQRQQAPPWLALINYWRVKAGLHPVTDNSAWDKGIEQHLRYLVRTPRRYMTGIYESNHAENPKSPYYTSIGAKEAASSDLIQTNTGLAAIKRWLAAPFHAIGMLRPGLTQVAFASYHNAAGLDLLSGLQGATTATHPILYPGPGSTTTELSFGGESPDPTQTCRWKPVTRVSEYPGLPFIILLPKPPAHRLTATLRGPHGLESTSRRNLCLVDEYTYRATGVDGADANKILVDSNAVLLIPKQQLATGTYKVTVNQPGRPKIAWSFQARA